MSQEDAKPVEYAMELKLSAVRRIHPSVPAFRPWSLELYFLGRDSGGTRPARR